MKKLFSFFLSALLLLGLAGNSFAINIPESDNPTAGPQVVTIGVYNNNTGDAQLTAGDVVIWDIDSSTGKNDNYVTVSSTADTYIVAGVVYPRDILAGDIGTIAVKGVVPVTVLSSNAATAKGLLCTSTTVHRAKDCANRDAAFGIVTTVAAGTAAQAYINVL